jgi:hypothetical protein
MGNGLSLSSRAEITARYARAYRKAGKKQKGRLLDEVCAVTGWSRDHARRRLWVAARSRPGSGRTVARAAPRPRARKYSYDAVRVLQRVWTISGGQCGKYLAVSMPVLLEALERHGELVVGRDRYDAAVRAELMAMSAATIDRYLAPTRARDPIRGASTTKPSPLLRSSISIRKAGDEVEQEPGFFEGDTVAHCGPTARGEYVRTVNLTDVHTGWTYTRSIRNNAHQWVLGVLDSAVEEVPFAVCGLDFDNGTEFLNHAVIEWAAGRQIFFTRSRPYKKNDQATIESKNNHLVRRYAFYYRYDSPEELKVLNRLWPLVNARFNLFTPTKKPIGWTADRNGRRRRLYDTPATPLDRLLGSGVLANDQETDLITGREQLNPAELGRRISALQSKLTQLASQKTDRLHAAVLARQPDTTRGILLHPTP